MINTVTIILANKRRLTPTDKAYVYSTSGYGGQVFSIARKMVVEKKEGVGIEVNDMHHEPATLFVINKWMFDKIKEYLDKMNNTHCVIIN